MLSDRFNYMLQKQEAKSKPTDCYYARNVWPLRSQRVFPLGRESSYFIAKCWPTTGQFNLWIAFMWLSLNMVIPGEGCLLVIYLKQPINKQLWFYVPSLHYLLLSLLQLQFPLRLQQQQFFRKCINISLLSRLSVLKNNNIRAFIRIKFELL